MVRIPMVLAASAMLAVCGTPPTGPSALPQAGGSSSGAPATFFEITASSPLTVVPLPPPFRTHLWGVAGQSAQLTARVGRGITPPADVSREVVWGTFGDSIATISATGVVSLRRAGRTPIFATYQGITGSTSLSAFAAPPTAVESFTDVLAPGEQRTYVVTVGPNGQDMVFVLVTSAPARSEGEIMLGTAQGGPTCRPPYRVATASGQVDNVSAPTWTMVRTSYFQVSAGQHCFLLLDPATVTEGDVAPRSIGLTPMTAPANYTLTIGVSGTGSAVVQGASAR